MKQLSIDIETFSSVDLTKTGVYRYVEAPDFEILLFAYSVDFAPVEVVDLKSGEELPLEIVSALRDENITKTAYNATFERICLSRFLALPTGHYLSPKGWQCTMVYGARLGFPLSLDLCAKAMKLPIEKMQEGKRLIRLFSCLSSKGERKQPTDEPEKWETFKEYCKMDVEVEQQILKKCLQIPIPETEQALYVIDQEINDRGVLIDREFVEKAYTLDTTIRAELLEEMKTLTGLENPNSLAQLKAWIKQATGMDVEKLNKAALEDYTERFKYWKNVLKVLRIRQLLGKTSTAKYATMLECVCMDSRIRGLLQFYGAARTGRWAGRLVQLQNLPQNHLQQIEQVRSLVKQGDAEDLQLEYSNPQQVLSELIRTSFIAKEGYIFHVCDFSAIEARVIAWLAGEEWVLEVFRQGGDIYCQTAAKMFHCKVEKHGENAHLRQRGKVAVLALGYGGGVSALEAMGGKKLGLTESEMKETVYKWRDANPRIVKAWRQIERTAAATITGQRIDAPCLCLNFAYHHGALFVKLPSGRELIYPRARIEEDQITYEGTNQTTRQWTPIRTYGGRLTENIVQAIARDVLGVILLRAKEKGFNVVFHVHDEIIVEAPSTLPLKEIEAIFSQPIKWAHGLPLKGAGYSTPFYMKD